MPKQYEIEHPNPVARGMLKRNFDFPRFAEHMRSKRRTQHYTVRGMANAIGISAAQYSRWENMHNVPTVPDFLYVCWFHDLNPMDYFLPDKKFRKTELMLLAAEQREWIEE